jgi:hypothetical protein
MSDVAFTSTVIVESSLLRPMTVVFTFSGLTSDDVFIETLE